MAYNLLVVDDSPSMRQVIRKAIRMAGIDVGEWSEAGNGMEALQSLTGKWIDLVITDLYMPVMDGYELVRKMKSDPLFNRIPILVVSTEGRKSKLEEISRMGIAGFIHKPFSPEQIRDVFAGSLGVKEYEASDRASGKDDF